MGRELKGFFRSLFGAKLAQESFRGCHYGKLSHNGAVRDKKKNTKRRYRKLLRKTQLTF